MNPYLTADIRALLALAIVGIATRSPARAGEPPQPPEKERQNLVQNASFESQQGDGPVRWSQQKWAGVGEYSVADIGRTGNRSVAISSNDGADIGWQTTVPIQPNSTYRLRGWIKTQEVKPAEKGRAGRGALLNLHNIQPFASQAITGTSDWTEVELVFDSGSHDTVQINCLFGGWGLAVGKAWYDDLRLERLSGDDWDPQIAIDATKKGTVVSKYIYGQFIEHLGRCIYGGIWAEMLEDRKFYYPVNESYAPYGEGFPKDNRFPVIKASPWQIVSGQVTMAQHDSFVGDHTPLLTADSAIRQNDLALTAGKEYEGYVWLRAAEGTPVVRVQLEQAAGDALFASVDDQYTRYPFRFRAAESTEVSSLTIHVSGGACLLGTVSLMPADNVQGMRADTLALLKDLNSPVYRWPGGNFVSGYNWKDGVGDRDRRPPRKNPAWTGVEHNDFGIDEFMTFCRLINTEPYIAVNSGQGQVESAVQQLQYCNGPANSEMGALRASHGSLQPYGVKWWGIGNEMYGGWQLGHMPLEKYIQKHNVFAKAMRAADPSIAIVAVGAVGPWSEGMMKGCADDMDLISEHFYRQSQPGLASHVRQMPDAVQRKAEAHYDYRRRFDSLKGKDIDIALDEWNYWYGPHVFGELGTRYFLKDALGVAAGIHEYVRQSDIMFMANYAQTVNVIGCIKTSKTDASFATTGLVLKLYRNQFGTIPLAVETQSPLDVVAALTPRSDALTVGIVNPTMQSLDLPLSLRGLQLSGLGTRWEISGDDPMAFNEPGHAPQVEIVQSSNNGFRDTIRVAPCSVTLVSLKVR